MPEPLHLHLLSDSTGETLEVIAKACLAQFDHVEVLRHFWPMVRSEGHLDRVLDDIERRPGLVLYTLVNSNIRRELEQKTRRRGIHAVSVLDPVTHALSAVLGQEAKGRPGRQHALDAAYFARVDAIQFTIAHDDGIGAENWEEADIILAGVSRTSKSAARRALLEAAGVPFEPVEAELDEQAAKAGLQSAGFDAVGVAEELAQLKALSVHAGGGDLVLGCDQVLEREDGSLLSKPV